jgi:hypothetical protein
VNKVGRDDRNLAIVLEKFMNKDFRHSMVQAEGESRYHLAQTALIPFMDPQGILDRIHSLTESAWLGQPQRNALRQFIKDYKPKGR